MYRAAVVLLVGLFLTFAQTLSAQETDAPLPETLETSDRVLLILDSSGSMWGQIDGTAKYEIARDVVSDLLSEWDTTHQLGLMAYGHRREGDCADIETLVRVSTFDRGALDQAVQSTRPLGKTPLTESLRYGAEAVGYTEAPGTIILLTDGLETCEGDPCAMAAELAAAGVNLTAHVIGFDMANEDTSSLQCIADETSGLFLSADTAGELVEAFDRVMETAILARNVTIRGLGAEGLLVEDPIAWNIYDLGGEQAVRENVALAPEFIIALEPGSYRVDGARGDTNASAQFDVPEGEPVTVDVVFATGTVQLSAVLAPGLDPVRSVLSWSIFPLQEGASRVASEAGDDATFTLPAGTYRGVVSSEDLEVTFDIEFLGGEVTQQVINLNAGLLTVQGVGPNGEETARNVSWIVFPGNEEGARSVAREIRRTTTFMLPAGAYRVVGTYQDEMVEIEVDLGPGGNVEEQGQFSNP